MHAYERSESAWGPHIHTCRIRPSGGCCRGAFSRCRGIRLTPVPRSLYTCVLESCRRPASCPETPTGTCACVYAACLRTDIDRHLFRSCMCMMCSEYCCVQHVHVCIALSRCQPMRRCTTWSSARPRRFAFGPCALCVCLPAHVCSMLTFARSSLSLAVSLARSFFTPPRKSPHPPSPSHTQVHLPQEAQTQWRGTQPPRRLNKQIRRTARNL